MINIQEFWGSKGNLCRNVKACREYEHTSWSAQQAQTSSKVQQTECYYQWILWNDRRSSGFYSEVAQRLDMYVLIYLK